MTECCLLQICCDPATRQEKAVAYYAAMGFSDSDAVRLADDLLKTVDAILALTPAAIAKMHKR